MKHSMRLATLGIAVATIVSVSGVGALLVARQSAAPMVLARRAHLAGAVLEDAPQAQLRPLIQLVSSGRRGYRDGVYTGPTAYAYYGWVKVQAVMRDGRLVAVRILRYPSDRATSRRIAHYALPRLEREVIRAQSTRVDAISGATLTSRAFLRSMRGALRRAAS